MRNRKAVLNLIEKNLSAIDNIKQSVNCSSLKYSTRLHFSNLKQGFCMTNRKKNDKAFSYSLEYNISLIFMRI